MRKTTKKGSEREVLWKKGGVIRGCGFLDEYNGGAWGWEVMKWEVHLKMGG